MPLYAKLLCIDPVIVIICLSKTCFLRSSCHHPPCEFCMPLSNASSQDVYSVSTSQIYIWSCWTDQWGRTWRTSHAKRQSQRHPAGCPLILASFLAGFVLEKGIEEMAGAGIKNCGYVVGIHLHDLDIKHSKSQYPTCFHTIHGYLAIEGSALNLPPFQSVPSQVAGQMVQSIAITSMPIYSTADICWKVCLGADILPGLLNEIYISILILWFGSWFRPPGNWNQTVENWTHGLVQSSVHGQNRAEGSVLSS